MTRASVHPNAARPHFALSSTAHQSASQKIKKKDSAAPFSSARLLTTGSARPLVVAFSSAATPHPPQSHAAPRSFPYSATHTVATRPICHTATAIPHAVAHTGAPLPSPVAPPSPVVPPSPTAPCCALPSAAPKPCAQARGRRWPGPSQAQARLAAAVPPSSATG
jgi:hypothetical protein